MEKISFILIFLFGFSFLAQSQELPHNAKYRTRLNAKETTKRIKDANKISKILYETDSFYDPKTNYAIFSGRVSDRDPSMNILKISSENGNVKFFRAGDQIYFRVASKKNSDFCKGYVRSSEDKFFVVYVTDLHPCWKRKTYFRRGTLLIFNTPQLARRVLEGSAYRNILLQRRKDLFEQLNNVNHFIWTFDQQRVLLSADYDKKILELQKQKQREVDNLISKKKDNLKLQRELIKRVDQLDRDLELYRVEKNELYVDRWHMDQDLGLPVQKRPQELKPYDEDEVY